MKNEITPQLFENRNRL